MQSKRNSLVEQAVNLGLGFIISMGVWQLVGPLLGYTVGITDNILITCIFTVVSFVRGYVVRRVFNSIN